MGQWTMVVSGTGAHHNLDTTSDGYIKGRSNDYDADLLFQQFIELLKSKGQTITAASLTYGGMQSADEVVGADYKNPHLHKSQDFADDAKFQDFTE